MMECAGLSSRYNLTMDPVSTNATECRLFNSPQLTLNSGSDLRTVVLSLNLTLLLHPPSPPSSPQTCPTDDGWDEVASCTTARASVCSNNNSLGQPLPPVIGYTHAHTRCKCCIKLIYTTCNNTGWCLACVHSCL